MSRRQPREPTKTPRPATRPADPSARREDPPAASPRVVHIVAGAVGLTAFAVYAATLNPTVSHGDSGEMIAVAHTLGVAHPPGFPLYTLLAKLASLLPVGTIAWRVNLFSALCDAGAAFFLCRGVGRWSGSPAAGVLAAGAFAFSPIVWPYAVTAEVFALNNLFVALLLDLTARAARQRQPGPASRDLAALVFVFCLGLCNHHILLLLAGPPLCYLLQRGVPRAGALRSVGRLVLAGAAGLLPYAYLLIAPHLGSEIVWGDSAAPSGFLAHVLRSEYGTFQLASGARTPGGDAVARLVAFLRAFGANTYWTGPILVAAALPALLRPAPLRGLLRFWFAALCGHVFVFTLLSNLSVVDPIHLTVQQRFWQQPLVVLAALMGFGLAHLARLSARAAAPLAATLALVLPLTLLLTHYREMDQKGHLFFRQYGCAILASLPQNAVLVITSDEAIGSVRFLQQVEGLRRDVRVLPAGQIASPWFRALAARRLPELRLPPPGADGAFTFRAFLDLNLPRARVFLVNRIPWEQTLEEGYVLWPTGLGDEVLPRGVTPPLAAWVERATGSFSAFDATPPRGHAGAWERYVETAYWKQADRFGLALARVAAGAGGDATLARLVTRALAPLVERHPSPPPVLLRNLGVAYQYLAGEQPSARQLMLRCWRRYLQIAPAADPDRALIQQALAQATGAS
jgi:hypothetical protein